jgi:23S rRNA pseudouridine1911/1915/1917 synthase
VTHPGAGHERGTLVNALVAMTALPQGMAERPGIVHRLDKDTSGLMVVARDDASFAFLSRAMASRRVERRYLALVRGTPAAPRGTIEAPVGRHPSRRRVMAVTPTGKPAVTHYRVRGGGDHASLLDVKLETGRTHQIRVHLSHIGHPVVGDAVYGGASDLARDLGLVRPWLHAWRLVFPHPSGSGVVDIEDPLPDDLAAALARAGIARSVSGP